VKLVDSSFLVDYARGDDAAIAYLAAHDGEQIGASTIVLSELYAEYSRTVESVV
jgi:predicted nucleic acid-binding protein